MTRPADMPSEKSSERPAVERSADEKETEGQERREGAPSYDIAKADYAGIASGGREGEEGLQAAKDFAEMIVDTVREGLLVLDLDLRVIAANESFYDTFGVRPEETLGRLVYHLDSGHWDLPELRALLEDILPEQKVMDDFDVARDFGDIGLRCMRLNARQLDAHQLILLAIEDVTGRERDRRQLRLAQERLNLLIDNATEYAIFLMDTDTTINFWNPGAERVLGWREEEILGQTGDIIFTQEDREAGVPEKELAKTKREGSARDDRWHVRKDGSRFWATGYMVTLQDEEGELRGLAKILRDDTQEKEAEEERKALLGELRDLNETLEERVEERTRQVRRLASTLTMAEQEERRRISQILHDDLQQQLYGIQMKTTIMQKATEQGDRAALAGHLAEMKEWVSEGIEITRNLTVDLSPPILKTEGLTSTLEWLQSQMKVMHGLEVRLEAEGPLKTPEDDLRVLLFQIVRELLFNVAKHAGVKQAVVKLRDVDHHVEIVVSDKGSGFDVEAAEAQLAEEGGFGLFSVRERLRLFGGEVQIDSEPGEGTQVMLSVPLRLE